MMDVLEYLRETSCKLAALADKDQLDSLAYIFRMAALDADRRLAEPSVADGVTANGEATATILPFRMLERR